MSKHRIQTLLDKTGGKIIDRYGSIQDFGVYSGNENDRIKTYPVTLKVRTGGVLDHWLFGRIVMDFEGMEWHKDHLLLDWNHNADVEIGVILDQKFETGDLICSAKLISRDVNDRVSKLVDFSGEGIPYEVSMTWGATQSGKFVVEDIPLGKEVLVNDKQGVVKGPVSIIRAWGMYGAAICPHGVDSSTNCQLDSENLKGQPMSKDLKIFTDKFGAEKGVEYMLDSKIETLEHAEAAHKVYTDAKEKAEQKAAFDKMTADLAASQAEREKLQKDFDTKTAEVETLKAKVADAAKNEDELNRLRQALPGVNVGDSATPPSDTSKTGGARTAYQDRMAKFIADQKQQTTQKQ